MHFLKNSIFIHFLQDYGLLGYSSRKYKGGGVGFCHCKKALAFCGARYKSNSPALVQIYNIQSHLGFHC